MWRLKDEDGATAVVVALLTLVLFGFGAIAVDAGQLYQERRELQNGADAAAMAAAHDCAKDVISCSITGLELNDTVDEYANANANDDESSAEIVELNLTDSYITVETETLSGGNGFLTHWFAWAVDHPTSTVRARATAKWDRVPGTLEIFPLAFCLDTFNTLTADGTVYGDDSLYPGYHVFYKTPSQPIECPTSDDVYEGGFGWLDLEDPYYELDPATCELTIDAEDWIPGVTGEGARAADPWPQCYEKLADKIVEMDANPNAAPLLVPIFDGWRGSGANGEFHIAGFGAFRPTGFNFGGTTYHPDNMACVTPANRCVRGWFTDFVTSGGTGTGGAYYGVVSVDLIK